FFSDSSSVVCYSDLVTPTLPPMKCFDQEGPVPLFFKKPMWHIGPSADFNEASPSYFYQCATSFGVPLWSVALRKKVPHNFEKFSLLDPLGRKKKSEERR